MGALLTKPGAAPSGSRSLITTPRLLPGKPPLSENGSAAGRRVTARDKSTGRGVRTVLLRLVANGREMGLGFPLLRQK